MLFGRYPHHRHIRGAPAESQDRSVPSGATGVNPSPRQVLLHAKCRGVPGTSGRCTRHTHITEVGAGRRRGPSTEKCSRTSINSGYDQPLPTIRSEPLRSLSAITHPVEGPPTLALDKKLRVGIQRGQELARESSSASPLRPRRLAAHLWTGGSALTLIS